MCRQGNYLNILLKLRNKYQDNLYIFNKHYRLHITQDIYHKLINRQQQYLWDNLQYNSFHKLNCIQYYKININHQHIQYKLHRRYYKLYIYLLRCEHNNRLHIKLVIHILYYCLIKIFQLCCFYILDIHHQHYKIHNYWLIYYKDNNKLIHHQ